MSNIVKTKKGKVIAIVVAIILTLSAVAGLLYIFRDQLGLGKYLTFDYVKGDTAENRVETAQYIPDIDTFIDVNSGVSTQGNKGNVFATGQSGQPNITQEEFQAIIDEFAHIDNYAGAGKYMGYDIYEIKNELKYVIEHVPAFNQWFRMPIMREDEGYISIPYYEGWAYYLELELEPLKLHVTRVCWATRSSYLDFENKTFVEDHEDGSSIIQYEIMKTSYFNDENGDEVIECHIYSVGVDHVKRNNVCNTNQADYHPYEYQYLRNVKDKSLITYHITAAPRYTMYNHEEYFEGWTEDEVAGDDGMDIRGLTPYGIRREFKVVNYNGYNQVDVTDIDQQFASITNPTATGNVSFDMDSNNIVILTSAIGMAEEDYQQVTDCKELLDIIAKHIVDNFELKQEWPEIYKNSVDAIEVRMIKGPFYGQKIIISDVDVYTSCRGHYQEEIEFDADADIYDMSYFDVNKEYSMSMALRERTTGEVIIVATDYKLLEEVEYNYGPNYEGERETYFRLSGSGMDLDADDVLRVKTAGVYDLTCVLTVKENGEDVIMFDTLETALLRGYYGLKITDLVDTASGITYKYGVDAKGGRITITVTAVETQA